MKQLILIFLLLLGSASATAGDFKTAVERFSSPPREARTKVWWFHGETETTRHGITADLEAFAEKGVGGVVYYDQVHGKAEKALRAMSPEWWEMLKFAAQEAKRLGLTFEASLSNGYVGGGPWITEEMAMQRLEVVADTNRLPELPDKWCREVAVLTIPLKKEEGTVRNVEYSLRGRGKAPVQAMQRPPRVEEHENGERGFQGYKFEEIGSPGRIECSDDSVNWRRVADLHHNYGGSHWNRVSVAIPTTAAKHFRIVCNDNLSERYRPTEIVFSPYAKTDLWEEKVGLRSNYIKEDGTPAYAPEEVLKLSDIHTLNDVLAKGGDRLLLRFYCTTTGGKTKHGREGMNGYECDKLSRRAAELQYNSYFKQIVDTVRACGADITGLAIDSHEAGSQNWTADFPEQFRRLRGYDLMPWLPAMVGYVIESVEATERFQQDVRRTIADLVATEYFGTLDSLCRRDGLLCTAQAAGNGQTLVSDNILSKGMVQRPQGEFWAYQRDGAYDIKEASSAAHLFNKEIASAEAYTDFDFSKSLGYLKPVMDHAYAMGLQEFVVCASAYQPWGKDTIPGSTGGGRQYAITRTNTQWNASKPFWDYQARCTAMMRLGRNVTDLLVLLGNDAPMKLLAHRLPHIPQGIDFDVATDEAFLQTCREYKAYAIAEDARLSKVAQNKLLSLTIDEIKPQIASATGKRLPFTNFHQRRLRDADIFFIYNTTERLWSDTIRFRSEYSQAQLWTPTDGKRYSLTKAEELGYVVSLRPWESCFIVLSNKNEALPEWTTTRKAVVTVFAPYDWTTSVDPETKYFSGTKSFTKEIKLKKQKSAAYYLHCDSIGALAEVIVNGKDVGTLWCAPMELNITPDLRNGTNHIELRVTNVNTNRLIGDAALPAARCTTYSYPEIAKPTDPLIPSGILSPVIITTE